MLICGYSSAVQSSKPPASSEDSSVPESAALSSSIVVAEVHQEPEKLEAKAPDRGLEKALIIMSNLTDNRFMYRAICSCIMSHIVLGYN